MASSLVALRLIVPNAERRNWLVNLIQSEPQLRVVGSGADFDLALAPAGDCDVCIVDLSNSQVEQPRFWAALHAIYPAARLVALTENVDNRQAIGAALQAGALYMVAWSESVHRLWRAILGAVHGVGFIPLGPVLQAMCDYFDGNHPFPRTIAIGDVRLDLDRHQFFRGDRAVHLTALEFELFRYLVARPGQIVGQDELARVVWQQPDSSSKILSFQIKSTVKRLRRKIELDRDDPPILLNVHGHGYYVAKHPR